MSGSEDARAEEIVIIRRRSHGEDEHHHGGVWKIAYADFMTAMMAFFLVMWLINATNTETKVSVASYFNPIKLTDNTARKKGLEDINQSSPAAADKSGKDNKKPAERKTGTAAGEERASATAATESGKAFRDPFNPLASSQILAKPPLAVSGEKPPASSSPAANPAPPLPKAVEKPLAPAPDKTLPPVPTAAEVARQAAAATILGNVQSAIRQLGPGAGPGVDVAVEGDAIVLSLTDTGTFGMFKIGSADPNDELAKLMQKIAPIVLANSQRIIVRGHTDGRRYRTDKNSNWRLSLSRAQSALALLAREGVDEARFERIEAYADRKLRVPAEPEAAANRRIEIVLRQASP